MKLSPSVLLAALLFVVRSVSAAEDGVSANSIVLGQSAALTGPAKDLGNEMRAGATAYFQKINEAGGVHGRQIELKSYDDGYEPARTTENTQKLIEGDKVFALFGYVGTPTTYAILPRLEKDRIPLVGAFTGAGSLRSPFNRYVFNIRASYADETAKIVDHLTKLGIKRIAVFYQNDAFGKAGLDGMQAALKSKGLEPAALATVERNSTEVSAAVRTISAANPDYVVMVSAYASCGAFVKAMRAAGSVTQYYAVSFVGSRSLATNIGAESRGIGVSQVVPSPWVERLGIVREYQAAMNKAGVKEYSFTSLEGYIAAKALVEGLRRAGPEPTREKFIGAMESLRNVDWDGFALSFSPKEHNGSKYVELTMIAGANGRVIQ